MAMQYRTLPHGGEKISVIGMGSSYIHESSDKDIQETVTLALDKGVNYFDLAAAEEKPFANYGKAFAGRREEALIQLHFGAYYKDGKYGWTQDMDVIKSYFQTQLKLLQTDYADFGFVHCIDEDADLDRAFADGLVDYLKGLKADGIIRHSGLSTHAPRIFRRFLDTGLPDMVMFSINPAYDYSEGKYAIGSNDERSELYRLAESAGVGISVMKPFGGGQLLDEKTSPFKRALTREQCIQYALDRPGVLTVLPGCRGKEDLLDLLRYLDAGEEARDYSVLGDFAPPEAEGVCVYCNHCQPCPRGLDVGLINKYYDLAKAGDDMAKDHYEKLSLHAGDCVKCGHCESRCPFHVKQEARMEEIARYFGM